MKRSPVGGPAVPSAAELQTVVDPRIAAEGAGLSYASADAPGIARRKSGKGFTYRGPNGETVRDVATLDRIRKLAIPPAWTSVWICADPQGHLQALGLDEKGRRQYRYHPRFREIREGAKFEHMLTFAQALPRLRRQVALDMAEPGLGRRKVLATVVHLLETTMIRVGNIAYAKENKSYGLTTLQTRHVKVQGAELRFHFKGKSGKVWNLSVRDRRVARIVKTCQELPGQHLFQYLDEAGERQTVTSADVNDYLKMVSGSDITAKDFRTWTGTVLAAMALIELGSHDSPARAKKALTQAIKQVSARLGNTPTICRKCYVHPEILTAYLDGALRLELSPPSQAAEDLEPLRPEEAAVLVFLSARLTSPARPSVAPSPEASTAQASPAPSPSNLRPGRRLVSSAALAAMTAQAGPPL
jgi:DNA topoisomerase-1